MNPKETDEINQYLIESDNAVRQASLMTKQLFTFSKGETPVKKITPIDELILDSAEFATRGSKSKCYYEFENKLLSAEIDISQIRQVIQNIVINAVQAMPGGGRIEISAENFDNNKLKYPLLEINKKYIKICIKDNGSGIKEEHLDKIFDPYFTTKKTGSGLGLAVCYSIIKKHSGLIEVSSEIGKGTVFIIYLPALQDTGREQKKAEDQADLNLLKVKKVLFMDDDETIIKSATHIFNTLKLNVLFAKNGEEALDLFKKAKNSSLPFDIIILDLTIKNGMGGKDTIKKIKEIDPDVKSIVTSGYSNDPVMSNFKKYGFKSILIKPFNIDMVINAIRNALE